MTNRLERDLYRERSDSGERSTGVPIGEHEKRSTGVPIGKHEERSTGEHGERSTGKW